MNDITFRAETWEKGGTSMISAASAFHNAAGGTLGRCRDLGALGCNNGGTLADVAIASIFPELFSALEEGIVGLTEGLEADGYAMVDTAELYRSTEETNDGIAKNSRGN